MTQEEKAKAYDKALEIAEEIIRYYKEHNRGDEASIEDLETIFPELQESEDERARKSLIDLVINYGDWLEKQGKQKPIDYKNATIIQKDFASMDEPKFKVGDWIITEDKNVHEDYRICRICKIDNGRYYIENGDFFYKASFDDYEYRLWTIQDAKDGDVLYLQYDGKEHIIIYKGVIKERFRTFISAYCAYNSIVDAFCFADVSRYTDIAYRGIMPATKEQRNLLFQKMHNAGYEWDAEKKELKKIDEIEELFRNSDVEVDSNEDGLIAATIKYKNEQKSASEIPFGAKDSELQEASYHIPEGFHAEVDGNKVVIKKGEQKLAWSEEDEKNLNATLAFVETIEDLNNAKDGFSDIKLWLKSLKDRVQPQSQWKPSDEQMGVIEAVINNRSFQRRHLDSLYADLKKLKEK